MNQRKYLSRAIENGFLGRFVYYINGNLDQLGKYKLDESYLIDLVNQVQWGDDKGI